MRCDPAESIDLPRLNFIRQLYCGDMCGDMSDTGLFKLNPVYIPFISYIRA